MLHQVIEIHELLDSPAITGSQVADHFVAAGAEHVTTTSATGPGGSTEFVRIVIAGTRGARAGGSAPTIGIIGRLGGIGARPARVGLVSDADGALTALACALKLHTMHRNGDRLAGDVIVTTHICPNAPIIPHHPVPFMDSPVDMATMNHHEVDDEMQAILVVDTTKGNRILRHRGFAITPVVKAGYILSIPDEILDLVEFTTGENARILPLTTQDITPYGNGLDHVNSLLQPATTTAAPVIGVAITAASVVPGSATGASNEIDIESAARFCLEVAKAYTAEDCKLHDNAEFDRLVELYGPMTQLQDKGS